MTRSFAPLVAAILAISLVGVGLSLTIPLISVRMEAAGFSAQANGISTALAGLATFFVSPATPQLARMLGARGLLMAALGLAVLTLVGLALVADMVWWFPLRFLFSAALSILFIVSEYAISALAPPARRGLWIGVYSTCLGVGFVLGPTILSLVGTQGASPFLVAALVCFVAGLPMVYYAGDIAGLAGKTHANAFGLIAAAPVLMLAALVFGAVETGLMGLLPVHALRNGYGVEAGALLVAAIALGNATFQIPLGLIADRMEKRRLLALIAFVGLVGSVALAALTPQPVAFAALLVVWGGIVSGLYMVALAEIGSRFSGGELAAANSAFVMLYAGGMLIGPPALGAAVDMSPRLGLFAGLGAVFALYLALALARRR